MNPTEAESVHETKTIELFLVRGAVAVVWAVVFAMAADSLTTGGSESFLSSIR